VDEGAAHEPRIAISGDPRFREWVSIPGRRLGVDGSHLAGSDVEGVDAVEGWVTPEIPLGGAEQDEATPMVEADAAVGVRQKTAGGREFEVPRGAVHRNGGELLALEDRLDVRASAALLVGALIRLGMDDDLVRGRAHDEPDRGGFGLPADGGEAAFARADAEEVERGAVGVKIPPELQQRYDGAIREPSEVAECGPFIRCPPDLLRPAVFGVHEAEGRDLLIDEPPRFVLGGPGDHLPEDHPATVG